MLGDTAGRSRRHPTGAGAVARSTARQRAGLAPPPGDTWVTVRTREKYRAMITASMVVCAELVLLSAIILVGSDDWRLDLLGLAPMLVAVTLAGVSQPWRRVKVDLVLGDEREDQSRAQPR